MIRLKKFFVQAFLFDWINLEANKIDNELDVVVFPTPPLPPTNIQCKVVLSTKFCKVPDKVSSIDFNKQIAN